MSKAFTPLPPPAELPSIEPPKEAYVAGLRTAYPLGLISGAGLLYAALHVFGAL